MNSIKFLFEPVHHRVTRFSAAPTPLLSTRDLISGSSRLPWRHFRFDDVISGPSLDPMLCRTLGTRPRKLVTRPNGHVGHMRLSDWLTKKNTAL